MYTIDGVDTSTYGVKNIRFNFATCRTGTATLELSKNWDESPASQLLGYWIEIERSGTRIFYGLCTDIQRRGTASAQSLNAIISDSWWGFEGTIYSEDYTYADGQTESTSRVILGGRSLTDQVIRILNYMGSWCTISGIDLPAINMPEEEVVDITVADALRKCLRWSPGALVYFNFDGWGMPKINIRQRWSSTLNLRNCKVGADRISELDLKEVQYPSVQGVRIRYERPVIQIDDTTGEQKETYELVSTDQYPASISGNMYLTQKTHKLRALDTIKSTQEWTFFSSFGDCGMDCYLSSPRSNFYLQSVYAGELQ